MAGQVAAQVGALNRAASLVGQACADLHKECDAIRRVIETLGAGWSGAGATACTEVLRQWDDQARKIIGVLDDFENNLRQSERAYAAADDGARSVVGRAASRLG